MPLDNNLFNTYIKPVSTPIFIAVNNNEYILFPKPSNIFEEIMENGIESIITVPKIAIQNISLSIPVMEKKLNA
jgi:hypothetical protein